MLSESCIVCAAGSGEAVAKAESVAQGLRRRPQAVYSDYATACHIVDADGSSLGEGVELSAASMVGTVTGERPPRLPGSGSMVRDAKHCSVAVVVWLDCAAKRRLVWPSVVRRGEGSY